MESYGPAALRVAVGVMFFAHGVQELFGMFGGRGLSGTAAYYEGLGLAPGFPVALGVGVIEFGGGMMLVAGAFTRPAAIALMLVMLGAIWNVQLSDGFFLNWALTPGRGHGFEYSLIIVAALVCLALTGPGALSIDEHRARAAESSAAARARLRSKL